MEPRTSPPAASALERDSQIVGSGNSSERERRAGYPRLTDHEVPAILKAAREAGAISANFTVVRLPYANAPLFEKWLETHFPDRKEKVLNRIKAMSAENCMTRDGGSGSEAKAFLRSKSRKCLRSRGARRDSKTIIANFRRRRFGVPVARTFIILLTLKF
jgi:DNA repair photolyase